MWSASANPNKRKSDPWTDTAAFFQRRVEPANGMRQQVSHLQFSIPTAIGRMTEKKLAFTRSGVLRLDAALQEVARRIHSQQIEVGNLIHDAIPRGHKRKTWFQNAIPSSLESQPRLKNSLKTWDGFSITHSIRGSALLIALVALVLITLLISISIREYARMRGAILNAEGKVQAEISARSGLAILKSKLARIKQIQEISAFQGFSPDLGTDRSCSAKLVYEMGYLKVTLDARWKHHQVEKVVLLGSRLDWPPALALAVQRASHPMVGSGSVQIQGDAALPLGSYQGKALHGLPAPPPHAIRGKILRSENLPIESAHGFLVEQARMAMRDAGDLASSSAEFGQDPVLSLGGKSLLFSGPQQIPLGLKEIRGPGLVGIQGDLKIETPLLLSDRVVLVVLGTCTFAEMDLLGMLLADSIQGTKLNGTGHVLALGRMDFQQVNLQAPSSIGFFRMAERGSKGETVLNIRGGSFQSLISSWDEQPFQSPSMRIEASAKGSGLIWTEGQTELDSPFQGTILTGELIARRGEQPFTNWLKETQIHKHPLWPLPFGLTRHPQELTWLK